MAVFSWRGTPVAFHSRRRYFGTHAQRILVLIGTLPYMYALAGGGDEKEFFVDNLLVRIHFIIEMIRWTGFS